MTDKYGTSAAYTTYQTDRGRTVSASGTVIDAALLVASEYLDARYRLMFSGTKVGQRDQEREWPRSSAYDIYGYSLPNDEIPREILYATYEIAAREIETPGSLLVDNTPAEAIKSLSVSGAVAIEYAGVGNVWDLQLSMPAVDAMLAPVLIPVGGSSALSGSAVRM